MVALPAGNQEHALLLLYFISASPVVYGKPGTGFLLVHCLPFLNCILNFGNVLAVCKEQL